MSMFTPGRIFTPGQQVYGKGRTWAATTDIAMPLPPETVNVLGVLINRLSKVRVRGKGGNWYAYHLGDIGARGPRIIGVGSTPEKAYQDWRFMQAMARGHK